MSAQDERRSESAFALPELKALLEVRSPDFWNLFNQVVLESREFERLFLLSSLKKKAVACGMGLVLESQEELRLAIIGGYNLYPLHELISLVLGAHGIGTSLFLGAYDSYVSEAMDSESALYRFKPELVLLFPSGLRCNYAGKVNGPVEDQKAQVDQTARDILNLTKRIHEESGAEILLCNFLLPPHHDPGSFRTRSLVTEWAFKKSVNLELGLGSPAYVHICDLEFLSYRRGGLASVDERSWFESKQLGSPALLSDLAHEIAHLVKSLRNPPKKVLVLDLDNTLWGGTIGDDGIEKIELGGHSPRGESYQEFQRYLVSLKERGVLLAVSSKNEETIAREPFERHPDSVLKTSDFAAFVANWCPKPDHIRQIAAELNLSTDSFVFVDDNPAEIDIVRQFLPEVETVLLGPDPALYASQLKDARLFEPQCITTDDIARAGRYRADTQRKAFQSAAADMPSFLRSLEMTAIIQDFSPIDVPRLAQLIHRSNQFNLTTRRRTEAEVRALVGHPCFPAFSIRLSDRFGDHGLISVVIGEIKGDRLEIDSWLMSCRVLNRQVEEEAVNRMVRLAGRNGCRTVAGRYIPSAKNGMVKDLYARMGFDLRMENAELREYTLDVARFEPFQTMISIQGGSHEQE